MEEGNTLFSELISRKILTVEDNHLKILDKVDISSYGSRAWAFTLQELALKGGDGFLFELGYSMGEDAAREILGIVKQKQAYLTNKLKDLTNLIEITGFGVIDIKYRRNGSIEVIVRKNHIIEYAKELYGKNSKICEFYKGVYSAFISVKKNKKIVLRENKCICKEDNECLFSVKNV